MDYYIEKLMMLACLMSMFVLVINFVVFPIITNEEEAKKVRIEGIKYLTCLEYADINICEKQGVITPDYPIDCVKRMCIRRDK